MPLEATSGQPLYFIGIMSGTSADAIDLVLVDFGSNAEKSQLKLLGNHSTQLPNSLREQIHALATPSHNEIDRLGALDRDMGELFAEAVNQLLTKYDLKSDQVTAIGSHGQTIRHSPPPSTAQPFTLQIGDPNIIAHYTGITTVADFRRRDMAAGGQGAPLVPAFHRAIFHSQQIDRAIVNIGGMANITWLPTDGQLVGFDTGPGNVLMDAWILEHQGKPYDANGAWAASGVVNLPLLRVLLNHPFFSLRAPKSTGREAFNLDWVKTSVAGMALNPADVQATLLELTAQSIADEIIALTTQNTEVAVCGGGAYNLRLMERLQERLPDTRVISTQVLGIAPEWIEAMAFAWLAKQTLQRQPGNVRAVTGAHTEVILGGVYFA